MSSPSAFGGYGSGHGTPVDMEFLDDQDGAESDLPKRQMRGM